MTASQLFAEWHTLTPTQRANEIENGLDSLIRGIDLSRTEKKLAMFLILVVRLVKETR